MLMQDKPNILMLAVTETTAELNMTHARPIANAADPNKTRTIEVYTKMDKAMPYAW